MTRLTLQSKITVPIHFLAVIVDGTVGSHVETVLQEMWESIDMR